MENTENPVLRLAVDLPFGITFSWKGKTSTVKLVNGEDVLKLADIFAKVLKENNIEFKITE